MPTFSSAASTIAAAVAVAMAAAGAALVLAACDGRTAPEATVPRAEGAVARPAVRVEAPPSPEVMANERYALNVFLVPLLDDTVPVSFTSAAIERTCGRGTGVRVDNQPLQAGRPTPPRVWSATWKMVGCRPFGGIWPQLDGEVEVVVFDRPTGFEGLVMPRGLVVTSATGQRYRMTRAFRARPMLERTAPTL